MIAGCVVLLMSLALGADARVVLSFSEPVKVNSSGWGFEPSIDVDSTGKLYVTAHKASVTNEGTRLASYVWSSGDRGSTWDELPSPLQSQQMLFSFEGDVEVDGRDRLYFVDTFGIDNWLSRWSAGPTWDYTTPLVTASAFDDRPWLAAHGDGIVYLLTTDVATHAGPDDVTAHPGSSADLTIPVLYHSSDGGRTWSERRAFPSASFCGVAASPRDDVSMTVVCATRTDSGASLLSYVSHDRGATFSQEKVFEYSAQPIGFVSVAYDATGHLYTAFIDGVADGNKLYVGRRGATTWAVQDVTPFRGSLREAWITAGGTGRVGLAFYGTEDVPPGQDSAWHVYGGVTGRALAVSPRWSITRADGVPVIHGPFAPPDFLQCVMAPDGALYVAYSRESTADAAHAAPPNFDHDIFVTRQTAGPNL